MSHPPESPQSPQPPLPPEQIGFADETPHEAPTELARPHEPARNSNPKKKRLIWVLSLLLVLLLAGAGVGTALVLRSMNAAGPEREQQESPTTDNTDKAKENEAETVKPANGPITIPDCETLDPAGYKLGKELIDQGVTLTPPPGEVKRDTFDQKFGPVAQATMSRATKEFGCYYVLNMQQSFVLFVAEIAPEDQQPLVTALKADDRFVAGSIGNAPSYISSSTEETSIGTLTESVGHVFQGNVWVSMSGSGNEDAARIILTTALDAVIAANPSLAG